jgi:ABC-type multidrug transport system ATPase subunit
MEIVVDDLVKNYGRIRALDHVSLSVTSGMYGLLGPNGAGKTTLMRIIATLIPLSSGKVRVGPFDVTRQPGEIRQKLGYIPQSFGFYKNLNAVEMLDYLATMKNIPAALRKAKVAEVIEQMNLTEVCRRKIGGFSGGMKQRLGIAQALLGDPQVIIVDEPTAGLDPEERVRFRNLFASLAEKRTVILSTHIVADIEASCSSLAVIYKGQLVYDGLPSGVVDYAREQVWNVIIPPELLPSFESRYQIISSRQVDGKISLKLLAGQAPAQDAVCVEPDLEDGYLALLAVCRNEVSHA